MIYIHKNILKKNENKIKYIAKIGNKTKIGKKFQNQKVKFKILHIFKNNYFMISAHFQ